MARGDYYTSQANTGYPGSDIKSTVQSSFDGCGQDCSATAGCVGFAFTGSTCWLKRALGTPKTVYGTTTGKRVFEPYAAEENTDYPGNDIKSTTRSSFEGCSQDCSVTPGCAGFTFSGSTCWLKRVLLGRTTSMGETAGRKPTVPTLVPPTPAPRNSPSLKDQVLHQTNKLREAHGLNSNVTWDDALAVDMQAWADSCPQKTGGGHGGPAGNQNLASFIPCGSNCMATEGPAWDWYDSESDLWNYAADQSADGNFLTTGHFYNSMNAGLTSMACGWSSCFNPTINEEDHLIWCNYDGGIDPPHIPRPLYSKAAIHDSLFA